MKNNLTRLFNDKGVTVIVVALLLIVFLGIAAIAVDVGYVYMAKNQLQNAADASALAAGRQLGMICANMTVTQQQGSFNSYMNVIQQAAKEPVNKVAGGDATIANADIVLGTWPPFATNTTAPRAVQVTVKSSIPTFFANIFGKTGVNVSTVATAALTSQTTGSPGVPFGVAQDFFSSGCGNEFSFDNCAAWTKSAGSTLNCLNSGKSNCIPTTMVDDWWEFTNGAVASNTKDLLTLFNAMKGKDPAHGDYDDNPNTWTTEVAVLDFTCSSSGAQGSHQVVGFATVTITGVNPPKTINVSTDCKVVREGRGGGSLGNLGSIPSLVQ